MGAEKIYDKMPETLDFMQVLSIFIHSSFTDSGNYLTGKYGLSFVMTIILFVAALIVTIIGIALRIWKRHTIDMLYGALGILDVACWLISVSQITPFLTTVHNLSV